MKIPPNSDLRMKGSGGPGLRNRPSKELRIIAQVIPYFTVRK